MQKNLRTIALAALTSIAAANAQDNTAKSNEAVKTALDATQTKLQTEALRLLIYGSVLSARVGGTIEASPRIQARYNAARTALIAPLPTVIVGLGTYYASHESARYFESIFKPITELVKAIGRSTYELFKPSIESSGNILEALQPSLEASWKVVEPVIKIFVNKGSGSLSIAVTGVSLIGTSSYFSWNSTVESALQGDYIPARRLLGYNTEVKERIDEVTKNISTIFNFSAKDEASLKEALLDELVKVAIANKFNSQATYEVDVLKIVKDRRLADADLITAAQNLRDGFNKIASTQPIKSSDGSDLVKNLDLILVMQATLEEILASGRLDDVDSRQAALLLYESQTKLKYVKANFQGLKESK